MIIKNNDKIDIIVCNQDDWQEWFKITNSDRYLLATGKLCFTLKIKPDTIPDILDAEKLRSKNILIVINM